MGNDCLARYLNSNTGTVQYSARGAGRDQASLRPQRRIGVGADYFLGRGNSGEVTEI